MTRRHGVLAGGAALYLGATVTGWASETLIGWATIWALLTLWTVVMRPAENWSGPGLAGLLRLLAALAVLAALAAAIWALGQLVAMALPPPPLWLGPGLALAGLALARAVWSPARQAAFDALLSDSLAELSALADRGVPDPAHDPARIAAIAAAIEALPPDPPDAAALASLLEGPGAGLRPLDLSGLLLRRAACEGAAPRDRLALVLGVTAPPVARAALGQEDLDHAFGILRAAGDERACGLFATRSAALLVAHPPSWRDMPGALALLRAARRSRDPALAGEWCALARRVRMLRSATAAACARHGNGDDE
ncbi:MAG: hypothetical protein JJU42_13235 [Rhodobacteraceae bacterium]|nr:hypothetical protein [Paracoccaceae bacterium]